MLLLLIFALLGVCCATPATTNCSEDAILKPIKDFNNMVEELHSPLVNKEEKVDDIWNFVIEIKRQYENVNKTCTNVNTDILNKLSKFVEDTNAINAFEASFLGNAESADVVKERFENFSSKQIRHYMIAFIYAIADNFDIVIQATKLMKNDNIVNEMQEGIIYSLNDTNIHFGKKVLPLIKELITRTNE